MKRTILFMLIVAIVITNIACFIPVSAIDDPSYYGDGTIAKLVDIREYLTDVYANTPYISITTQEGIKKIYFNVEYFIDLGLYAYGDPQSVVEIGSVNDFKEVEDGYYIDSSSGTDIRGEYRYIGLSPTGLPVSNSRFPPDREQVDFSELEPMKYSELSDHRKRKYNIYGVDNEAYQSIQSIIDSAASPALDFLNEGISDVPLRGHLDEMGYIDNTGKPTISLFEYGIIYNWSVNGGTIRMFFRSVETGEFYCYKTFVGPVSPRFCKKAPEIEVLMSTVNNKTTYYIPAGKNYVDIPVLITGCVVDYYGRLSAFQRKYSFTREDVTDVGLSLNAHNVDVMGESADTEAAYYHGKTFTIRVYRRDFRNKVNEVALLACADVSFGGVIFTGENEMTVTVVVQSNATPAPQSSPQATATATEEPALSPSATPSPDGFVAHRRW